MTTRAPLLLAPKASALPAPPAPNSTKVFPAIGEACDASPFSTRLPAHINEMLMMLCTLSPDTTIYHVT